MREIDEAINRLANSEASYTFHGRDVYAYTGARLAADVILFKQVGPRLAPEVMSISGFVVVPAGLHQMSQPALPNVFH